MTRRRQCRHCDRYRMRPVVFYIDADRGEFRGRAVEVNVCRSCSAWLPLGPSNDTPEVEIEIKAAALAANRGEPFGCDRFEYCPHTKCEDLCALCEAFWLAHEINAESRESQ